MRVLRRRGDRSRLVRERRRAVRRRAGTADGGGGRTWLLPVLAAAPGLAALVALGATYGQEPS
ncbi:hypothetical protein ACIPW5_27305 [Streptomyces sp. NPDC090077]|uniref:hypothetical protein n=1 Tax=Streptomyces sp. NPDC090077 TaxID=3365938 RepID=UPI003827ACD9